MLARFRDYLHERRISRLQRQLLAVSPRIRPIVWAVMRDAINGRSKAQVAKAVLVGTLKRKLALIGEVIHQRQALAYALCEAGVVGREKTRINQPGVNHHCWLGKSACL